MHEASNNTTCEGSDFFRRLCENAAVAMIADEPHGRFHSTREVKIGGTLNRRF